MNKNTVRTIFLDECGYTGRALLDEHQPVFVLASLGIEEAHASKLKEQFFPGHRALELKHKNLVRRPKGRQQVLRFLEWLDTRQELLGFAYAHKEFATVAKMVDWIIEPSVHKHGGNLYMGGANIALANLTYVVVRSLAGETFLRDLLRAFQTLVRDPSMEHLEDYVDVLCSRDSPKTLNAVLENYRLAVADLGATLIRMLDPSCLDLALSFALSIMARWSERLGGASALIHDQSSELAKEKALWNALTGPEAPKTRVGWDRRTMEYPVGVTKTTLASSQDWVGLQLADVVAGAITRSMKAVLGGKVRRDDYGADVLSRIGDWECSEHIWPSKKVSPEELGTVGPSHADPIEYIEDIRRALRQGEGER